VGTVRDLIVALTTYAAGLMALCSSAPQAAPQEEYTLEISRQPLMPAIRAFSIQTGLHVGFFPESPADENILVGPVHGTLTVDAALSQLLGSDGLTYEWINERSIYIAKQRLEASTTEKASEAEGSATTNGSADPERRWPGDRKQHYDIEFVIVIGTRLSSLETESQSVAVLNRRRIESYGVSTLAELFEYLPQMPFMRSEDYRASGEQYADLRGLGAGTTLILINGRRVAGSATSFDTGGFDVNTIPLTAVQRIEVLLDSPSVAVGADAIGGVINVVLKDEIPEPTMEVRYGAAHGGAEERRVSLGVGTSREVFRGAATFDVFQRDPLLGAERDLSRNQDYRRFGSRDLRSLAASPGNIFATTQGNLPGLDSSFAAIPVGSTGVGLTPVVFRSTAGELNRTSLGRYRSIIPDVSRMSLVASGELRLSPAVVTFAEVLGTHRENELQIGPPTLNDAFVPASNAFNPFGEPVTVSTTLQGMHTQKAITNTDFIRAVSGVRGKLREWEGEISGAWISEHAKFWRDNELDPSRLTEALASSDPDAALNVFRDGPAGSPALLTSLIATPRAQKYSSESTQGYARAQGPLTTLPAGNMTLMFGGEWRREELSNLALMGAPHRTVSAVFAEIQAPLVDDDMNIRAVQQLSFSVGMRSDDYSERRPRNTPQYGLIWQPRTNLKLRASYGEGHRPPSLYELHGPRISGQISMPDPQRGNEIVSFVATAGGNTDLAPTSGHTWTTGFEFMPEALPDLYLSAGYWRTTINHGIGPIAVPVILADEELFPGRVIRAEQTPQDIEAGIAGVLKSVDASPGNFGLLKAAGVDINISLTCDSTVGRFTPSLSATWNDEFRTASVHGMLSENRIGIASEFGTIPEWRAIASVGWSQGPFALFFATQYVSAYDDAFFGEPTGRTIPASILVDAQASLHLDALVASTPLTRAVKLTAGVKNLFDQGPHFAELGLDHGYDLSQGDRKQRFWYVRLAKQFREP
jgi:iron complex outermembrane receptor protein